MEQNEVEETLRQALEIVDAAGTPDELKEVALEQAIYLLTGRRRVPFEDATTQQREGKPEDEEEVLGDDPPERIARELDLPPAAVRDVYQMVGDRLDIGLPRSSLGDSDAEATRQLTLLMVYGRQTAGLDDVWTDDEVVREVCREFNVYQSQNFMSRHLREGLADELRISDEGLRLSRPGREAAHTLLLELAGIDSD